MRKNWNRGALFGAIAWVLCIAACGGNDHGTCDQTNVTGYFRCVEADGKGAWSDADKNACTSAGGTFTLESCTTVNLIACCNYNLGFDIRECWYQDSSRSFDPKQRCESTTYNGKAGVWEASTSL